MNDRCVALFASIHYVIRAEKVLRESGIWCDLVPTPRELSSDCGMAMELRIADLEPARRLLEDPALSLQGIYQLTPQGPQELA